MSNARREPLLNDERCEAMADICNNPYFVAEDVRNLYEAERAKDDELIQMLVNVVANLRKLHSIATKRTPVCGEMELEEAKERGFTPRNP